MNLPEFVGDQTPKVFDEFSAVNFFSRVVIKRANGGFDSSVAVVVDRIPLNSAKKYKNIEDILSDVSLIPLDTRAWTEQDIRRQIAQDSRTEFPKFFPEFSIYSVAGKSVMDKPIAYVNHPDGEFYVPCKEIKKYIRRIPVDTNTQETV